MDEDLLNLAKNGRWDKVIDILTKSGENVARFIYIDDNVMCSGDNIVHLAIGKCIPHDVIRMLPFVKYFKTNNMGENYLHTAVRRRDHRIVRGVYSKTGISYLASKNNLGETPLFTSGYLGSRESFEFLLHESWLKKDDITSTQRPYSELLVRNDGDTILHLSIRNGLMDIALRVVLKFPELITLENRKGYTPLHDFACQYQAFMSGHKKNFMGICSDGTCGKTEDCIRKTRLSLMVALLMISNMNASNFYCGSLWEEQPHLADPIIVLAVKHGIVELVDIILKEHPKEIGARDKLKRNLFFVAVENKCPEMLEFLLKTTDEEILMRNAFISEIDANGNNLLHVAARPQHWSNKTMEISAEIMWFEKVEALMLPPMIRTKNADHKTPMEIFDETHKDLVDVTSKWYDTSAKAYCGLAMFAFTAAIGSMSFMPKDKHIIDTLGFLLVVLLIVLFSSVSIFSFVAVICAPTDARSYSNGWKKNPTQLLIGLISLLISLTLLLILFFIGQKAAAVEGWEIIILIWIPFVPLFYFVWLVWPLFMDLYCIRCGYLQYYMKRSSIEMVLHPEPFPNLQ